SVHILFFSLLIRPPPTSTLFPYTTLFRSLTGEPRLDPVRLEDEMIARDGTVDNPSTDDEQTLAIRVARRYLGDRLIRVARPHRLDRKSTRLNSSHVAISYAVFCLKKKTKR